jgi:hypothetical protein
MRLTNAEQEAIRVVLCERLAGDARDLEDALGISEQDAIKMMARLESALGKLQSAQHGRYERAHRNRHKP